MPIVIKPCIHPAKQQILSINGLQRVCRDCGGVMPPEDKVPCVTAHTLAGLTAVFISEFGRYPRPQEIWNNAIVSWRDLHEKDK